MNGALSLRGVEKSLGGRTVLKGISFDVLPGDVFGYLGPNGAGKTTTIRVILGLLSPDAGEILILGERADRAIRRRIGFVLENDGIIDGLTVKENLELFAKLYGIIVREMEEVLELVGLGGKERERAGTLSKGMRRRLALARALIHDPDLLILDEPTSGLDPTGQIEIRELIVELSRRGKTVFLSSHNLDEVERICNRIALIHRGEIVLQGAVEELRRGGTGYVADLSFEPPPEAIEILRAEPDLGFLGHRGRELLFDPEGDRGIPRIAEALSRLGLEIEAIRRRRASLEEIYRRVLGEAEG